MVLGPQSAPDASTKAWADNPVGLFTELRGSMDGSATWLDWGTGRNAAFDVFGTAAPSSVPEPSSLLLLGAAVLPLFVSRR
jgi:hypothetical protein